MKVVAIGNSGHLEYALSGLARIDEKLAAIAPGSAEEDLSAMYESELAADGTRFYDNYQQMIAEEEPDIAVINPRYFLNGQIAIHCLNKGVHCFVEKPLSLNETELDGIVEAARSNKVQICTMMYYRYHPAFYAACTAVLKGVIGEPLLITVQKSYKMGNKPEWTHHRDQFGGIISWVGSHAIDWIYWITHGSVIEVTAAQTTKGNKGFGELESTAACFLRLGNGGQALVNIDYLRPDTALSHGDDRLRVVGDNGIIEVMDNKAMILKDSEPPAELPLEPEKSMFVDFMDQVESGKPCRISAEDVFNVTRLCIKAQQAADTNRPVQL